MSGKSQIAVGVDAGSLLTRCVVCLVENEQLRFLGSSEVRSAGWSKGRIADEPAVSDCIRLAVTEAERSAGVVIESVVIGVGGSDVEGANSRGVYEFGWPREVEPEDLAYAVERASHVRLEDDRVLLHVFPQSFTVDGRAGFRKPLRAVCSRLEANVHVITGSMQEHRCLVGAVHQAHLAVEETVFEPVAAAYAAVMPDDRNRGVAVVNIGLHSTDLVIYDGDAVLLASSVPIFADHFVRDVAWIFKVSYEDASRLVRQYGCALLGLTADNSLIEVPAPEGRPPREAARRELNEILEARAEELFLYVRAELARVGMEQSLVEGVVLCGGGACLNGMCDMAERVLNCQARHGLVTGVEDWPDELENLDWTTVGGLAMYSARLKVRKPLKRRAPGLVGMVFR